VETIKRQTDTHTSVWPVRKCGLGLEPRQYATMSIYQQVHEKIKQVKTTSFSSSRWTSQTPYTFLLLPYLLTITTTVV